MIEDTKNRIGNLIQTKIHRFLYSTRGESDFSFIIQPPFQITLTSWWMMTARMTMTRCLRPRRVSMLMVTTGRGKVVTEEANPGGRGQPSPTSSWSASRTNSRPLATSPCASDSTSRSASTSPRPRSKSGFRTGGQNGRSRTLGWMSTVASCLHLDRVLVPATPPSSPRALPSLTSTTLTPPSPS